MNYSRKNIFLPIFMVFFSVLNLYAENPIAKYYNGPEGYPTWTDEINWNNVINMAEYTIGSNDFRKFENARDELYEQGGGVLYYPAGEYSFTGAPTNSFDGRGLMLKSGVVILGEAPSADQSAIDGQMELPTKFNFRFNKKGDPGAEGDVPGPFNLIGIMPSGSEELKDIRNVGIAWVELNGAVVYFGAQMTWGETYATAGAWKSGSVVAEWKDRVPDGLHPMDPFCGSPINSGLYEGAGEGRFVFGCVLKNSALPAIIDYGFGETGFYVEKFIARIGIYGSKVFIANNALTKPTKCFKYKQMTSEGLKEIIFDYGFAMGIDVNKDYCNINANKKDMKTGGYWGKGVVIRDNWVYNHGNKGFEVSGTWVTIKNNKNMRDYLEPGGDIYGLGTGWTLTINGYKTHQDNGSSDGFLNRAFDLAGKALWIDNNEYNHTGTPYPSNDGEGILCQEHGGTEIHSWAITNNHGYDCHPNGMGYIAGWDVENEGCFIGWNITQGVVGHMKAGNNNLYDCAFVSNTASDIKADAGGESDVITECPKGNLQPPINVEVDFNINTNIVQITWEDATNEEIAYRVDRREKGIEEWKAIAYRPRQSYGHENNEPGWLDYTAPRGKYLEYRVVAVSCDKEDQSGAAEAAGSVIFPGNTENPVFSIEPGTYDSIIHVGLSCATDSAIIYYTIDGSLPNSESVLYQDAPVEISSNTTLRAIAYRNNWNESKIVTAEYIINLVHWNKLRSKNNIVFISPNPASDKIEIGFSTTQTNHFDITVYDISGQALIRKVYSPVAINYDLDIGVLESGIYMIEISIGEGRFIKKVVKK